MDKGGEKKLAETMLSNIYLIPFLLGEKFERVDLWHSSSDSDPEFVEYLPERIQEAILDEDLTWIRQKYNSVPYKNVLKRHIQIHKDLEDTPIGETRSALVEEIFSLLDGWGEC